MILLNRIGKLSFATASVKHKSKNNNARSNFCYFLAFMNKVTERLHYTCVSWPIQAVYFRECQELFCNCETYLTR